VPVEAKPKLKCSVDGCDRIGAARGYCLRHYYKFRRYGDPTKLAAPNQTGWHLAPSLRQPAPAKAPAHPDAILLAARSLGSLMELWDQAEEASKSLDELGTDECRWPMSGGRLFCGEAITGRPQAGSASRSYCAKHGEIARRKVNLRALTVTPARMCLLFL
jgi:hypothetical protein